MPFGNDRQIIKHYASAAALLCHNYSSVSVESKGGFQSSYPSGVRSFSMRARKFSSKRDQSRVSTRQGRSDSARSSLMCVMMSGGICVRVISTRSRSLHFFGASVNTGAESLNVGVGKMSGYDVFYDPALGRRDLNHRFPAASLSSNDRVVGYITSTMLQV